jgi:hypothetical protein
MPRVARPSFVDTRGSYVAIDKQLVALLRLDNVVVVTTDRRGAGGPARGQRRIARRRRQAQGDRPQMHHHRAEHCVVVRGTAQVTIGDNVTLLQRTSRSMCRAVLCIASKIPARLTWS